MSTQEHEKATPLKLSFLRKMSAWYLDNPILVYSMGKVGSSSIVNSLRSMGISEIQPHSLSFSRRGSYFVTPDMSMVEEAFWKVKSALMKIKVQIYKSTKSRKKIQIISLAREPISRNISAFFEQIQHLTPTPVTQIETDELISLFWSHANHRAPKVWFDSEIRGIFGIDIFNHPFDRESGTGRISEGNVEILLLTLEKIAENTQMIADFIGASEFHLDSTNRAERKEYKEKYKDFLARIRIPEEYINNLYASRYMQHFYAPEEISTFRLKWEKNISFSRANEGTTQ